MLVQVKISRKPFSLDPNLGNMKDNITSTSKQMNWNIIAKELKVSSSLLLIYFQKFGIKVDSDKKAKIIEGRNASISEVLSKLFEFDNTGGQSRFGGDAISEINYGPSGSVERDLSGHGNQNDSTNISIDGKDSSILLGVGVGKKKDFLDPLSSPGGVRGSATKKTSKLPANLITASPNLKRIKASIN